MKTGLWEKKEKEKNLKKKKQLSLYNSLLSSMEA